MTTEEINGALNETFQTLKALQNFEGSSSVLEIERAEDNLPPIEPIKSIQKNKVVCLDCDQAFKMLSPKHLASHGLNAKEYRKKYGFSSRQPLCVKALSERRSQSGKERGIPENLKKSIAARAKE